MALTAERSRYRTFTKRPYPFSDVSVEEVTVTQTLQTQEDADASITIQRETVEKVKRAVITDVMTETIGGAVAVALSPQELCKHERRRLRRPKHVRARQVPA